eukprot:504660-Prorocentrum_minimum.AAC.1
MPPPLTRLGPSPGRCLLLSRDWVRATEYASSSHAIGSEPRNTVCLLLSRDWVRAPEYASSSHTIGSEPRKMPPPLTRL